MLWRINFRRLMQLKWWVFLVNQRETFCIGSVEKPSRRDVLNCLPSHGEEESPNGICSSNCTGTVGTVLAGDMKFQLFFPQFANIFHRSKILMHDVTT